MTERLPIAATTASDDARRIVAAWAEESVPETWRTAAAEGGPKAVRLVRSRDAYEAWYPVYAASGLVVPTWPVAYGGLDLPLALARAIDVELRDLNLGRLNPLGLNLVAPALFTYGTEEQRARRLPAIVENREVWCQLFSEPGAGSDLASLATRATRDGDEWVLEGQKVWTTWAQYATHGIVLTRTDPAVPKRRGITYLMLDMHQPGVDVRPLRGMHGEAEFNEVFLNGARALDSDRVGAVGEGWKVANATLSGERQMVSGGGSGGVDKIGGAGIAHLLSLYRDGAARDANIRDDLARLYSDSRVREWTNLRIRANARAGRPLGPESSIGKIHQGHLNQEMQLVATRLLGADALAWEGDGFDAAPFEVTGMLRSRANTIEGGTTEVNKNVVGERTLGLPREPDPWRDAPWSEVPR